MKKLFILTLLVGIAIRLLFAFYSQYPSTGEDTNHIILAKNLYDGKGFVDEYIYLFGDNPPVNIIHPSNSYFMPMTSIIIYLSFFLFGKSILVALIPSIITGLLISFLIYLFMKEVSSNKVIQYAGFSFSLFLPVLFMWSFLPSSEIYFSFFVLWALYWITIGMKKNSTFLILSSVPTAFAFLTDKIGLILFIVVFLLVLTTGKRNIWKSFLGFTIIFLVLSLPWLIRNSLSLGYLNVIGIRKLMFFQNPEDLFYYSQNVSLNSFLGHGILNILFSKMTGIFVLVFKIVVDNSMLISVLGFFGFIIMLKERSIKRELAGYILFFLIIFFFLSLLVTHQIDSNMGKNCIIALSPFLIIISLLSIEKILINISYQKIFVFIIIIVFICCSIFMSKDMINTNNSLNQKYLRLSDYLDDQREEIIIMTRFPIELNYSTGYKTVMIPNEDENSILTVAQKYNINYILFPTQRASLEKPGGSTKYELKYADQFSDLKLYRIINDSIDAKNTKRK